MWKCDLSHTIEVWGRVWLFQNHRTIPGNIRRAIESQACLTQMMQVLVLLRPCFITRLVSVLGALTSLSMWWVDGTNTSEEGRAVLRVESWHMNSVEMPRQDFCVTRGETGPDICSSLDIFRKHIFIFGLHQIWNGAKSLECVRSY